MNNNSSHQEKKHILTVGEPPNHLTHMTEKIAVFSSGFGPSESVKDTIPLGRCCHWEDMTPRLRKLTLFDRKDLDLSRPEGIKEMIGKR